MRTRTVHPLGAVAVPAEHLETGRVVIVVEPSVEVPFRFTESLLSSAAVNVVNRQELWMAFTATRADWRVATVGDESLLPLRSTQFERGRLLVGNSFFAGHGRSAQRPDLGIVRESCVPFFDREIATCLAVSGSLPASALPKVEVVGSKVTVAAGAVVGVQPLSSWHASSPRHDAAVCYHTRASRPPRRRCHAPGCFNSAGAFSCHHCSIVRDPNGTPINPRSYFQG